MSKARLQAESLSFIFPGRVLSACVLHLPVYPFQAGGCLSVPCAKLAHATWRGEWWWFQGTSYRGRSWYMAAGRGISRQVSYAVLGGV